MNFLLKSVLLSLFSIFVVGCSGIDNDCDEISTLIITSNNYESRALAEHLQVRNNQLVMLIPSNPNDKTLYVSGPDQQLMKIDQDRFYSFINFTGPKHVIILGNSTYVPSSYVQKINQNIPKYVFDDNNWELIAWQLEELTGYCGLAEEYLEDLNELVRSKTIDSKGAPTGPKEPSIAYPSN
ncbi:MAG: hypothetical protein NE328_01430 [Lentisphaeraceae bacterium]|nr:hypothetical protein [Lentisphaeraceae bacterium]